MEGRWKYKIIKEIYRDNKFDSTNYIMDNLNHFEKQVNNKMSFEQWEPIGGMVIQQLGILVLVTQSLRKFVPFESFNEDDPFDDDEFFED
jgi:hypothetical protein